MTINLGDAAAREAHQKLSPFGKIPALRDTRNAADVFETSIIIEYLDRNYAGKIRLIPQDAKVALEVRFMDRIFDLHVMDAFQPIVNDRLRPAELRDPASVEAARTKVRHAYGVLEKRLAGRTWAAGQDFSMADCAAAPSLFYAAVAEPLDSFPVVAAYRRRLLARPSVARAIDEAKPFFSMFPATDEERLRLPK